MLLANFLVTYLQYIVAYPVFRAALIKYDHHVVVANLLHNRSRFVCLILKDTDQPVEITMADEEILAGNEIEEKIVRDLASRHQKYIDFKAQL